MEIVEFEQEESIDPALSLALDEVLFRRAKAPILRYYRWKEDCGTLGFFRKFQDLQSFGAQDRSRPWFRRLTGGGAALHGAGEPGITAVFPRGGALSSLPPSDFYREFHRATAHALREVGYRAELVGVEESVVGFSCLKSPVENDVLENGRKILGGALRRNRSGILYQGMLKVDVPEGFGSHLVRHLGFAPRPMEGPEREWLAEARVLARDRYATREWLECR